MRLEGWPRVHAVHPSFATAALNARPQDEVGGFPKNAKGRPLGGSPSIIVPGFSFRP
jgi:hypothetical protein